MKLTVRKASRDDLFQDIVRVHRRNRPGIETGKLCRISTARGAIIAIARNYPDIEDEIGLDMHQREELDVSAGEIAEFAITPSPWYDEFLWVWRASNPIIRTAGRLGIVSLILGILGLVLGLISILIAFKV